MRGAAGAVVIVAIVFYAFPPLRHGAFDALGSMLHELLVSVLRGAVG